MSAFGDFDAGNQGSEGPWIAWTPRGTMDGEIPAKSFYLRDADGKKLLEAFTKGGVVLDIHNMKTGWQRSEGVVGQAPDWKWNPSISRMEPQPGDDYKRGLSIPCAISKTETATWEQAGAAVWNAFTALVPALQQGPDGKLPVVKLTGTKLQQFKRGSTVEPVLEVIKWVDRPDSLKAGVQAGFDAGDDEPSPKAQKAPEPVMADEDEF